MRVGWEAIIIEHTDTVILKCDTSRHISSDCSAEEAEIMFGKCYIKQGLIHSGHHFKFNIVLSKAAALLVFGIIYMSQLF